MKKQDVNHAITITRKSIIVLAEDDEGHAELIIKNLRRSGIESRIVHFTDGEETLNFLFREKEEGALKQGKQYLMLLDIRMPKVDGIEMLRLIKQDSELQSIPVIMITTTDDPREIEHCFELGCSRYMTKPIDYDRFVDAVQQLARSLLPAPCHSQESGSTE
jgi:CheY-like chemotaxis protein